MLALQERTQAASHKVAAATEGNYTESCPDQQGSTQSDAVDCRLQGLPEASENERERLPGSFDELSVHLDQKFARLVAEVEQMAQELREAGNQAEQLRHRLLDGRSF